jgi:ribosome recycling factor
MLDSVTVDYYGTQTPINQVGTVQVTDARTLTVQPWEKNMLAVVERAIINANLGLNPSNDGSLLRIPVPPLTEERRIALVKTVKHEGENGRIAIRKIRQDANQEVKTMVKDGLSEDAGKRTEKEIQDLTTKYGTLIDEILESKEKEIMTV